jgi:hypothetical protein
MSLSGPTLKTMGIIIIALTIISVVVGATVAVFSPTDQPTNQPPTFTATPINTNERVGCPGIPGNFSIWLVIGVEGNRSNTNLISTTVYNPNNIRIDLQLNASSTAYVHYVVSNSTYERIDVPLPNYWSPGDIMDVGITYQIRGFNPATANLAPVPVRVGNFTC